MIQTTQTQDLLVENKALKETIKALEHDLLCSQVKEEVWREQANKIQQASSTRIEWLEKRNKELENPEGDYNSLGWIGKVVFTLRKLGRPLRKAEIMRELTIMDTRTQRLSHLSDASGMISVVLKKEGVEKKRLVTKKISGTRGLYYALPEWLAENGELEEEFMDELY